MPQRLTSAFNLLTPLRRISQDRPLKIYRGSCTHEISILAEFPGTCIFFAPRVASFPASFSGSGNGGFFFSPASCSQGRPRLGTERRKCARERTTLLHGVSLTAAGQSVCMPQHAIAENIHVGAFLARAIGEGALGTVPIFLFRVRVCAT